MWRDLVELLLLFVFPKVGQKKRCGLFGHLCLTVGLLFFVCGFEVLVWCFCCCSLLCGTFLLLWSPLSAFEFYSLFYFEGVPNNFVLSSLFTSFPLHRSLRLLSELHRLLRLPRIFKTQRSFFALVWISRWVCALFLPAWSLIFVFVLLIWPSWTLKNLSGNRRTR